MDRGRCQAAGKPYRLVDTHLESINYTTQVMQAIELVDGPTLTSEPIIVLW
jgi:hypothetical protein